MKHVPIDPQLFVENRRRLGAQLLHNSLAIVNANDVMPTNADGTMGFHQNADLFYLTGVNQEESVLLLAPDAFDDKLHEVLFVRQPNEHMTIWEGHKLSKKQATAVSGVKNVKWLHELPSVLHGLMIEADHVYLNTNEHARASSDVQTRDLRFIADLKAKYPLHDYQRLARIMNALRTVKSPLEIDMIRKAADVTRRGFLRTLRMVKPGVNEADVEAEFAHEFTRRHATFAYPPIICSGANNVILHYNQNDQVCRKGELVLMDVAAGLGQYMSDLTRTIPVSGRFTRRQKQVYNAVLRVFRAIAAEMKPGVLGRDLRKQTEQLIERECVELGLLTPYQIRKQDPENPAVKKYFMHGVAHSIGLDVHDVGLASMPYQPGWVLTCEPGIYIKEEGFGIRLENCILVTESEPVDLMADIPLEADDIENRMNRGR